MYGHGFPPRIYTQNSNESMNRLVKAEENAAKFAKKADGFLPSIRTEAKRESDLQFLAVIGRVEHRDV